MVTLMEAAAGDFDLDRLVSRTTERRRPAGVEMRFEGRSSSLSGRERVRVWPMKPMVKKGAE